MNGLAWIALGLLGLSLGLHLLAWLTHVPVAARVFGDMPWLPVAGGSCCEAGEPVEFSTRDGVRLCGTYLRTAAPRRRGVLLFCHELNGDRWSALRYTRELRQRGFDVLTFDFRNHGASQRQRGYEPMPWVTSCEVLDVRAAVDYLATRPDADPRGVGLLGVSRGGTAALCAAAGQANVACVVTDAVVPTERMQLHCARRWLRRWLHLGGLVRWLPDRLLALPGGCARLVIGGRCCCRVVNVERAVRRVSCPTLLIHGGDDPYVPLDVVRQFRKALQRKPPLWVVPHARHAGAFAAAPDTYQRRLLRFFFRHLTSVEPASTPLPHDHSSPIARRKAA